VSGKELKEGLYREKGNGNVNTEVKKDVRRGE